MYEKKQKKFSFLLFWASDGKRRGAGKPESRLQGGNRAAGDHRAGIAGRLCFEVIRTGMDDDRPSDDIRDMEALGEKCAPGEAVIAKQRRKIACMGRMGTIIRIEMTPRIPERFSPGSGAAAAFMDVEAEERRMAAGRSGSRVGRAVLGGKRKAVDGNGHQGTVGQAVKIGRALQLRIIRRS